MTDGFKEKLERQKKRVFVLDSSAFISGYSPFFVEEKHYTPFAVEEELKDLRSRSLFEAAAKSGVVIVRNPSSEGMKLAEEVARRTGDSRVLSLVDKHIIALAFDLAAEGYEPIIVTDDYALQNVARDAGFTFKTLVREGIRSVVKWALFCPSCRQKYPTDYPSETCEVCGSPLRRVRSKRRRT
ncbi:MAG: hypothetical protein QXK94_00120 [Candidatus Jordarchaeales archaeon]